MVNNNIQGVIPIDGRGFTARIKLNFESGEYRKLSNARLKDGIVQTRYNIRNYFAEAAVSTPVSNPYPFVGFINDNVIVVNKTQQFRYKNDAVPRATLWAPSSLPTDAHADSFNKIVGVFEYNNFWYWLTWRYFGSTGTSSIWLYSINSVGANLDTVAFASLTATQIITTTETGFIFDNFFIYKERLWVCTNHGLFFSGSTTPLVFAVPNGGFFKLRDQNINFAFPHKDSIFMLCDASVHSLTFVTDPNTDGYIREVSNVIGGDHGTSHGDQAYMLNVDGLYAITANSMELVRSDFEIGVTTAFSKLISWENYLIVIKYSSIGYEASTGVWPNIVDDIGRFRYATVYALEALIDSNVWFIDMTTGACHTLDFNDQFTGTGIQIDERGHITDIIVNPNKDINRGSGATIMTSKRLTASSTAAQIYLMDNTEDNFFIYDTVVNAVDNIVRRMKPNMQIEFSGFSPDGNEYLMKKFRNLEVMGNFAWWDFEVLFAYDNQDYGAAIDFISDLAAIEAAGTKRSPYPGRIGLNQRGRSISILMRTKNPRTPIPGGTDIYERVEIVDMRVLWTYTGRGPTDKTQKPMV